MAFANRVTTSSRPSLCLRSVDDLNASTSEFVGPSPEMSLKEFFEDYFQPIYLRAVRADPKTTAEYKSAIARWAELTGDPPLKLIDNAVCAMFVAADLERASTKRAGELLSPNTVRKHCAHLQMVLNLAGPQTREYPTAAATYGLFGEDPFGRPRSAPWFTRPPERDKLPTDGFTIEEINLLLAACEGAERPSISECRPGPWWRALLRFDYNTGIRIGTIVQLRRKWIYRRGDDGWVEIPSAAYKKKRAKVIYLSREALSAIDAIPTRDYIFPWPQSIVSLHRRRRKLLEAAGIPEERWLGFHGIRKAIGTELWRVDPKAAQTQLGHQDMATTRKSYVNPGVIGASLSETVGPAMRRVRQPRASDAQTLLF